MSLRAAIDAKCRDCIHDPLAGGTWRQQVEACRCADCPLWAHRPVSGAGSRLMAVTGADKVESGQKSRKVTSSGALQ